MWEEGSQAPSQKSKFKIPQNQIPIIAGVLVLIIVIGIGGYFFISQRVSKSVLGAKQNITQDDAKSIVDKIYSLIDLPKDELPKYVTVVSKDKLVGQDFFKNTEDKDVVLIFEKNKIAVLFRPSTNKIINYMTNISLSSNASAPTVAPQVVVSPSAIPSPTKRTVLPSLSPTPRSSAKQ